MTRGAHLHFEQEIKAEADRKDPPEKSERKKRPKRRPEDEPGILWKKIKTKRQ